MLSATLCDALTRIGTFAPPLVVHVSGPLPEGKVDYPPEDPIHKGGTEYMTSKLQASEWDVESNPAFPAAYREWAMKNPPAGM